MKRLLSFLLALLAFFLELFLWFALTVSQVADAACCSPFPVPPQVTNLVLVPPTYIEAVVLVANTAQTVQVPVGGNYVVFSGDCNFYVVPGSSSPAVPAATTTNGSSPAQNPTSWNLRGIAQMSFVSAIACHITLSYYS